MLGKIEGKRRRGQHRKRWLDGINSVDMSLNTLWEIVNRETWCAACSLWAYKELDTAQ